MVDADTEQRGDSVMWNKTNGSMSIHTFLSITMRFFKAFSTTGTGGCVSVEVSGSAWRGASRHSSTSSRL